MCCGKGVSESFDLCGDAFKIGTKRIVVAHPSTDGRTPASKCQLQIQITLCGNFIKGHKNVSKNLI
jgi:hypothetical protein